MEIKKFELTENEADLLVFALNEVYVDTSNKLLRKDLGDLERKYVEKTNKQSKELLLKIGNIF